jgi:hypothetical protein
MKKLFFMTAVVGLALTSCSQEELSAPVAENNEITFAAPLVGKNTRAVTEVGTQYDVNATFGVWAKYNTTTPTSWTAGDFYIGTAGDHGVQAEYKAAVNGWGFATPYYWPKNGNLSFIAYSPYTAAVSATASVTGQGIQFTDYTVGDAADVDLLFSEVARNKTKADVNTVAPWSGIDIAFKHALSSVRFAVKTKETYTGTTIKVKNINVLNAYSVADFNQGLANTDDAVTGPASTNPCWSEYATERSYTAFNSATPDKQITVGATALYVHNGTASATANTTDLILLPQNLEAGNQVKVQVEYTITSPNGNTFDQVTELPLTGTWLRGVRYTYTVVFGLDEIYLDPTVEEWKDVTDLNVGI